MKKLLVFKAVWCGPCKAYAPILEDAKSELEALGVEVVFVDVDDNAELTKQHNIRGVPTSMIGNVRWSGSKSKEEVLQIVKDNI